MSCHNHPERPAHARGLCRRCYDGRRGTNPAQGVANPYGAGAQRPGATVKGDTATVVTEPAPDLGDLARLIRERGLSPDEWEVVSATLNEWDGPVAGGGTQKLRQLKIQLKRKQPLAWLFPAADVAPRAWRPHPLDATLDSERPQTVVLLPDPHCPFEDYELDSRVEQLLYNIEPERVVSLGDVCDFSSISRHRDNPAWFASAQENIQGAFQWWAGKRDAAPTAVMDWIEGNHDFRLRGELLQRAERMYGIKPADIPGEETGPDALSLQRLCHLDRLGVNFVGPPLEGDEYHHAGLDLSPALHATHGFLTGANSVEKTLDRLGMSTAFGHTHKQDLIRRTIYRGRKVIGQVVGAQCGTLARVEGGLGYASNPEWVQGCAVATLWPDGSHDIELVPFLDGALRFRGRRY